MKSTMMRIMSFAFAIVALGACGKSGGDNPPVATVPTYGIVNNQCLMNNTTVVAMTYCQPAGGVSGYYWNGSQCLVTNTNQVVDPSLCNNQYGHGQQLPPGYQVGQGAGGPYIWTPYPNGHYPIGYFPTGYPSFPGGYANGYTSQACNGIYLWLSGGSYRSVTCTNGACRGYFVYAPTTYRPILCL